MSDCRTLPLHDLWDAATGPKEGVKKREFFLLCARNMFPIVNFVYRKHPGDTTARGS